MRVIQSAPEVALLLAAVAVGVPHARARPSPWPPSTACCGRRAVALGELHDLVLARRCATLLLTRGMVISLRQQEALERGDRPRARSRAPLRSWCFRLAMLLGQDVALVRVVAAAASPSPVSLTRLRSARLVFLALNFGIRSGVRCVGSDVWRLLRREHHRHVAAFELRLLLDLRRCPSARRPRDPALPGPDRCGRSAGRGTSWSP